MPLFKSIRQIKFQTYKNTYDQEMPQSKTVDQPKAS